VQCLEMQSELCGTVAGEASFKHFAQTGMLLDKAFQITSCGLAQIRGVRLLEEAWQSSVCGINRASVLRAAQGPAGA
jgi:hypothetical protein